MKNIVRKYSANRRPFVLRTIKVYVRDCLFRKSGNYYHNLFPNLGVVYVHIPKAAGTTICGYLNELDRMRERRNDGWKRELGRYAWRKYHQHLKASDWLQILGPSLWGKCFCFTFVRNPWSLMVSSYFWWKQKAIQVRGHAGHAKRIAAMKNFDEFIQSAYGLQMINECVGNMDDWHEVEGEDALCYIGKVEDIEKGLIEVATRLGFSEKQTPEIHQRNKTQHQDYREYYTSNGREIVEERFSATIERFGYRF